MWSCRPGEGSVEPARAGAVELNAEHVNLRLRSRRHWQGRVRGMEHVPQLNRVGKATRHLVLDLNIDQITEADRERSVGVMPFNGCLLDSGHLSNEWAQHRRRSAEFTAEH